MKATLARNGLNIIKSHIILSKSIDFRFMIHVKNF